MRDWKMNGILIFVRDSAFHYPNDRSTAVLLVELWVAGG